MWEKRFAFFKTNKSKINMSNSTKFGSRARRAASRDKKTAREFANLHPLESEGQQTQAPDLEALLLVGANKEQQEESDQ